MINFDRLIEDRNVAGLVSALRRAGDADLREAAARCLGTLGEMEAVESLIRSCIEDPDLRVKKAARTALDLLVGGVAGLAISSYGTPPGDEWLEEIEPEEEAEDSEEDQEPYEEDLETFIQEDDLEGLVACLRMPDLADFRKAAAVALGELGDQEAVEALIRSNLEDPDAEVRQAAFEAINLLSGGNARLAIQSYRSMPLADGPWLVKPDPNLVETMADSEKNDGEEPARRAAAGSFNPAKGLSESETNSLVTILYSESNLDLRLKAIQALKRSPDTRAIQALAGAALESDIPALRKAARQAFEDLFGDEAGDVLNSYRVQTENSEEDEGADEEEEEEAAEETPAQPSPSPYQIYSPGIQEEGFPWRVVILGGIGILLLILLILLLK
jgi:HEAT repeat protein